MDWMETTVVIEVSVEQHTSSTICSMCAKFVCPLIVGRPCWTTDTLLVTLT